MNPSDDPDIRSEKEIFFAALDHPSADGRAAFLDGACGNNPVLRQRVDKLLADHFESDSFMQAAAVDAPYAESPDSPVLEGPGTQIGRYKLLQRLGEGGFGIVYMAEQKEPVKRRVALKIIKLGMDTQQVVARFEAERQALAMMEHPNIARVLDGGATETGRPYFVMELVKGVPITKYCDDNELPTKERLALFIQVCQAIQHAHQKGIIHRDIKPSNVMITLHDGNPVPKVIDFGIAKATQQELTEKTLFTQYSQFIGTPAYMSPEQAEMSGLDVDTRTDIYSLGVLLYELLVGRTPLDGKELMSGSYDEIRRRIKEQEPSKPSTRVSTYEGSEKTSVARQRKIGPNQLSNELRGDLDWIVLKSLEKDRTRRYETANGFALDINRFLNDEPVSAVAPSVIYKFRKFARRNKLIFGAATAITASLIVGLGLSIVSYASERAAHRVAEEQRAKAVVAQTTAQRSSTEAIEAQKVAVRAQEEAESLRDDFRIQAYQADMSLAGQYYQSGRIDRMNELVEKHRPETGKADLRGFEWYHWWQAGQLSVYRRKITASIHGFEMSPDLSIAAVSIYRDRISVGSGFDGRHEIKSIDTEIAPFAFTPDGTTLVIGESLNQRIRVYDVSSREDREFPAPTGHDIGCLTFSPIGELMATGGRSPHTVLWNTATWEPLGAMLETRGRVWGLAFGRGGKTLMAAMEDSTVVIWAVADSAKPIVKQILSGHGMRVTSVVACPGTDWFATGSADRTVRLWSPSSQGDYELTGTYDATGPVNVMRFSPDGDRLFAGTTDNNSALIWDVRSEPPSLKLAHTIKGHSRKVTGGGFARSNQFHSVSSDGHLTLWNLDRCEPYVILDEIPKASRIAFTEDGDELLISDRDGNVYRWDFGSRELKDSPAVEGFRALAISERGIVLAGVNKRGFVAVLDTQSGELRESSIMIGEDDEHTVVVSSDGSTVTWMSGDGIHVWNPIENRARHLEVPDEDLPRWARELHLPTLSNDGEKLIVTGTEINMFSELWSITTDQVPELAWRERAGGGPRRNTAFSRDGTQVAVSNWDSQIRLFDAETGELRGSLEGHSKSVGPLAFSRDGSRLASVGDDHRLCVWNPKTGGLLGTLQGHQSKARAAAWSPRGDSIAVLSEDGTVKVWTSTPTTWVVQDPIPLAADLPPVNAVLVPPDATWRWLHPIDGVDPAGLDPDFHATFYAHGFDDATWQTGQDNGSATGGFGYGDQWFDGVDIGTPKSKAVGHSAYFRCRFETDRPYSNLELRCQRDDGVIVYLDGQEVARDQIKAGEEAYRLPAVQAVPEKDEHVVFRIPLKSASLPDGEHVLAISLHNPATPSSDLRIGGITLVEVETRE